MAKKEPVLVVDSSLLIALGVVCAGIAGLRAFLNAEWGRHK